MDLMKYQIELYAINNYKTLKNLEEILRKYISKINLPWKLETIDITERIFFYRLASKAYHTFVNSSKKPLPGFIVRDLRCEQQTLLNLFIRKEEQEKVLELVRSYETFMDIFEFDPILYVSGPLTSIKLLDKVIGTNPFPFDVSWNIYLNNFENSTTTNSFNSQHYVNALRLNQVLNPKGDRSVLNMYLADRAALVKTPPSAQELDQSITLLEQQLTALKTFKESHG